MDYWIGKILHFVFIANVCSQQFFNTMPPPVNTNFTCRGRDTGFYADVETNCRVYHTCDENGNKFTYYCPAETAFRQEALVCDHAHLVDCANGRRLSPIDKQVEKKGGETSQGFRDTARRSETSFSRDSTVDENNRNVEQRIGSLQPGRSNSAYTRSFRITQNPQAQVATPQTSKKQKPTFVLSSSVFLRDEINARNNAPVFQNNRLPTIDNQRNFNFTMHSLDGATDRKEERGGDSPRIAATPTTTLLPPFDPEFQVKQFFSNPMIFRPSNFDREVQLSNNFSYKFSTSTTKKPPAAAASSHSNNRFNGPSGRPQNDEKFTVNHGNERHSSKSLINGAELEKKMSSSKAASEFSPVDKSVRGKKSETETTNNFHARSMNNEKTLDPETRAKSREAGSEFSAPAQKEQTFSKDWDRFNNKNGKDSKPSIHERPPFFHDNFPYSETLRSMQAMAEQSSNDRNNNFPSSTTSAPLTTAGTEFPVLPFAGTLSPSGPNELDEDPYYPKRSTTTEVYYKLKSLRGDEKKSIRFSTKRPWPGSLNFDIPEVLPDLNTLDDLVDRRKFFFIPRVKTT
ncbi:uncharacterized protein [Venturia canescens]|uniref:uncharacterized protein n=1 Tax=Venturia canescens TaxID=32260 RepID=UPI001C9C59CA|nr:uncharacterized protein LOC122410874 [Venturia canescens]